MTPRLSVIIPTLNEAARLAHTLAAARSGFGNDVEYIVTDGGSTDDTLEIALQSGARVVTGAAGRGAQLERGFRAAQGDVCVFLHADTVAPPRAHEVIRNAVNHGAAGGAFLIELEGASGILRLLQRGINLRTRLFRYATGDQVIFARSDVLQGIGGVPDVPLFEDVRLCSALKRAGNFVIVDEKVRTSSRLWRSRGSTRTIGLHVLFRLLHALGVSPYFLAKHYPAAR